jgi:translation initiation factor 3 subunit E
MLKELIKVIQQERYTYSDPVTEFLECLYVNYDFEGAQKKLRECEEVRRGDPGFADHICITLFFSFFVCFCLI